MREKIKIELPIIVEGKYDKITLDQIFDAVIISVGGFGIFNSKEKQALVRRIGERGIILLTDSDGGGKQIRSFLSGILPKGVVHQLYIPQICGKERRKQKASKSGFLGVEGMKPEVLVDVFAPFISDAKINTGGSKTPITSLDFYNDGISGAQNCAQRRAKLAKSYCLPDDMSAKALLEALNLISSREEYKQKVSLLSE